MNPRNTLTEDQQERAMQLRREGMSYDDIATKVNVRKQEVINLLKRRRVVKGRLEKFRCSRCGGLNMTEDCQPCSLKRETVAEKNYTTAGHWLEQIAGIFKEAGRGQ